MLLLRKRIHDKLTNLVMWLDYIVYRLLSPFHFKSFPKETKRIVLVELFQVGDLLVATPAMSALKKLFPQAELDIVVLPSTALIIENNPDINNVISYTTFNETKEKLKKQSYDLGVILHPGSWKISALLLLAKVRYRVGCTKSGITYGKGYFLHKKIKPNTRWQHKIEDNLDVIRALPIDQEKVKEVVRRPVLTINHNAESRIKKMLLGKKRPLIGIHAPSKHKTQRWYPLQFATVTDQVQRKYNATIIFTGTAEEQQQVDEITATMQEKNYFNALGKTTMHEFAALIKQLDLLISVDTSAIHIASAVNTPVIALFGPTIPTFWGPTSQASRVIWKNEVCTGCRRYECIIKTHECMKSITPEDVLKAVAEVLRR